MCDEQQMTTECSTTQAFTREVCDFAVKVKQSEDTVSAMMGRSPGLDAACGALHDKLEELHEQLGDLAAASQRYTGEYERFMRLLT